MWYSKFAWGWTCPPTLQTGGGRRDVLSTIMEPRLLGTGGLWAVAALNLDLDMSHIHSWKLTWNPNNLYLAILCGCFGMVKRPFKRLVKVKWPQTKGCKRSLWINWYKRVFNPSPISGVNFRFQPLVCQWVCLKYLHTFFDAVFWIMNPSFSKYNNGVMIITLDRHKQWKNKLIVHSMNIGDS